MTRTTVRTSLTAAAAALLTATTWGAGGSPAVAAASDEQRFVMTHHSRDGEASPTRVTATGPVHGAGTEAQEYLGRTPAGETLIRFTWHLPDGTLTADAVERHTLRFDPQSCTAEGEGVGTWEVVEGTGAYAGATGGGTFTAQSRLTGRRAPGGECLGPRSGVSPHTSNSTTRGEGVVTLP